eukprot:Em0001g3158a
MYGRQPVRDTLNVPPTAYAPGVAKLAELTDLVEVHMAEAAEEKSVRGPLDVLKEKQGRELMPYLMIMRERSLERITQLVQTNRSKAHHKQTVDAYPMLRVDGLLDRLGHVVGCGQVRPEQSKIQAVQRFPIPVTRKETDASGCGIGGVLRQVVDVSGEENPMTYYIGKMAPMEKIYATIEKECLSIKAAIQNFRVYLLETKFTIVTDHKALKWLNTMKDNNPRWYIVLQPHQFKVVQ